MAEVWGFTLKKVAMDTELNMLDLRWFKYMFFSIQISTIIKYKIRTRTHKSPVGM